MTSSPPSCRRVGECIALPADLSTEPGCRGLAAALAERESLLHILVNNAGNTWGAPFEEFDDAAWDRVLSLNVKGVFHTTKFLTPLLRAASSPDDPARVINIGSIDGIMVSVLETYSYSASKAAVHQLTRNLAKRLAPSITVNAIAPGPFESKMMAATLEAFGEQIAANAPLKRIGRPDDMAGAAIFLASRAGAYLTGALIPVDGGIATVGARAPWSRDDTGPRSTTIRGNPRKGRPMRLSTMLDYSRGVKESADHVADLERAGLDIVWVAEAYGLDGPSQMGYIAAKTERIEIGSAILPIYSRTPGAAGADRGRDRRLERRTLHPRARGVGPAGHRGLARRALHPAPRAHPGDHRHLSQGVAPGGGDQRGPLPHPPAARVSGPDWASR